MVKPGGFEELARRLLDALPQGVGVIDADVRRNVKAGFTQVLKDMDLVTREEYELQAALLARTREKLERLEERADALERRFGERAQRTDTGERNPPTG